jgi:hypothetical protein
MKNLTYHAVVKYINLVANFAESWIGLSERWEPSDLGAGKPVFTHLPADTLKRDAVVAAFKVRRLSEST